ncbi:Uncharacterised protein [Vibrio cholerae]|uniref:Uncharacterized protein n=1 Tax=Vibrio cholerae TaxID=666 RepID=A0A655VJ64_VIBCL|nr:Uncharacterised protein [Vibrio cholerae]
MAQGLRLFSFDLKSIITHRLHRDTAQTLCTQRIFYCIHHTVALFLEGLIDIHIQQKLYAPA